jgi:hypothetical protein
MDGIGFPLPRYYAGIFDNGGRVYRGLSKRASLRISVHNRDVYLRQAERIEIELLRNKICIVSTSSPSIDSASLSPCQCQHLNSRERKRCGTIECRPTGNSGTSGIGW